MSKETFAGEPLDPHAAADEIVRLRGEVERLTLERDYWARARNEWEKSARLLEEENKRLTRERDDFHMDYRIKCDVETKAALARAEAAERERDEARQESEDWRSLAGKRFSLIEIYKEERDEQAIMARSHMACFLKMKAERDAAIARAEAAERERDWHKSLTQSHDLLADNATQKTRAEAAEAKVAELAKEVAEWRSRPDALRADKAEAKVAKLRKVLEFYSNRMTYTARSGMECGITQDHFGDRARAVLQETEQ